ncbi:LacI family DNA-binding transcriptional regulator [Arcticibacter svalbardensis]|uniref:LacI family DNA-binding transcriptional regulator n=1 Tax=Arcticibacter svalbardensis TaxID=1288027 RepID=UPI0021CD1FDB|nr:LacI family DNA-binding transcriptional regulator [Arcticibacter svalbardensis]
MASLCEVSKTTVSFILNYKAEEKRISADVIKKAPGYIAETSYQPNQLASSFRMGITKIIGLIVENISDRLETNGSISSGV